MSDKERIAQLEAELAATKRAATHMMVGMAMGIASTPEGREELAAGFAEAASDPDPAIAEMAQAVADAIRAAMLADE
ncbi:hypothetical protein SAMN04489859_102151 [Paracoccus alcaliphilus]|uniref:Uncharacterized protein n=1 Tax=Paracoccus alcaliphilus TaxID=34002 RepID=A0A1H8KCZ9_9RHOB|nr:hypothetical protein [Paracoccus alcaliphilus]WCR17075.1 hypothetical protein JHW40_11815 [Paracoccus alcaliphilus]SEN90288.1 hypothetical protein SAMN04489859_102151 [Paracoccus alcaliphilus]